jgi:hypothetical protein
MKGVVPPTSAEPRLWDREKELQREVAGKR